MLKTLKIDLSALVLLSMSYLVSAPPVQAAPVDPGSPKGGGTNKTTDLSKNPIVEDINVVVNFLSIGVGVVVIIMIILGGIQYSAAGDNPQALSNAKQRIINALVALVAYLFIFAFLQWLIPGGVF